MSTHAVRSVEVSVTEYTFECDVAGESDADLVLLLHGFPQTSHSFRHELPALAEAGFQAVAPNQRGYSAGARPTQIEHYATPLLMRDALAIADRFGARSFHLVGHDWGGQLAWLIAAEQPQRVRSLCVLSRPHPAAFAAALSQDAGQAGRSSHHSAFQDPEMAQRLLENGAQRLRAMLSKQAVPESAIECYLARLGTVPALDAALHWYRAAVQLKPAARASQVPAISVPTLYMWGDADATVGRNAAEATASYVTAPYSFQEIPGAGHFLTDQAGPQVTRALLEHITRYR